MLLDFIKSDKMLQLTKNPRKSRCRSWQNRESEKNSSFRDLNESTLSLLFAALDWSEQFGKTGFKLNQSLTCADFGHLCDMSWTVCWSN